ncbi:hypothetical protein Ahy_A06g030213 isoform C [Arachis hypogaea]|uniref:Uncharacterized protein n=1 Tax=Arachis hypogaea TaxID=3818 RepID=A0A445CVQ7_ARAHY|nr:hypothetical protein Ahy_A06g030213 isoform C [Arachis hypogaea]
MPLRYSSISSPSLTHIVQGGGLHVKSRSHRAQSEAVAWCRRRRRSSRQPPAHGRSLCLHRVAVVAALEASVAQPTKPSLCRRHRNLRSHLPLKSLTIASFWSQLGDSSTPFPRELIRGNCSHRHHSLLSWVVFPPQPLALSQPGTVIAADNWTAELFGGS